jgi:hypothetical protein
LALSYYAYNIGHRKIVELTQKLVKQINFKDDELKQVLSKSNQNIELENDKKMRLLTYVTIMCDNSINEFKQILINRSLKESFIDYFTYITHNISEFMKNEGCVVATIKLLTYTHQIKLNEQSRDQRTEMINKIISFALEYYHQNNYIYVVNLIQAFKDYFGIINSDKDYIWYLQNVYLRSFEFYETYDNYFKSNELVPKQFDEALLSIVQLTSYYFNRDEDNDIKVSSIRKMVNFLMNIIINTKINTSYVKVKPFWFLLHGVIKKDLNNVICGK